MKLLVAICLGATVLWIPEAYAGHREANSFSRFDELLRFDEYGELSWKEEKARLDNFAIVLLKEPNLIGYVLVYDAAGGCPGEAQARAIRARSYVWNIEASRGIEWFGGCQVISLKLRPCCNRCCGISSFRDPRLVSRLTRLTAKQPGPAEQN